MAVDQALLESAQAGGRPALRLYRWSPACLSLGRNQPAAGLVDLDAVAARGVDLVRRPTGGLAVLHDRELTYAVAVPVGLLGSPRETYVAINRALVAGLRCLGVPAQVADGAQRVTGPRRLAPPCFHAPAPGEVVVGGRKLVGSAQRTEKRTVLQHGSLLLDGDQSTVLELMRGQPMESPPATLAMLLGEAPAWAALAAALHGGFEESLGIRLAPDDLSCDEWIRVRELEPRYRSDAWTWLR